MTRGVPNAGRPISPLRAILNKTAIRLRGPILVSIPKLATLQGDTTSVGVTKTSSAFSVMNNRLLRDIQRIPAPIWRLPTIASKEGARPVSQTSGGTNGLKLSGAIPPLPSTGGKGGTTPPTSKNKIDANTDLPTLQRLLKEANVKARNEDIYQHELVLDAEIDTHSISGIVFVIAAFIHHQMGGSLHRFDKTRTFDESIFIDGKKMTFNLLLKRYRELRGKEPSDIIWRRATVRTTFLAMIPFINDIIGRPNGRDVERQYPKTKLRFVKASLNELRGRSERLLVRIRTLQVMIDDPSALNWSGRFHDVHDTLDALHHRTYELACYIDDSHGEDWGGVERDEYLERVREFEETLTWLRGMEETLPENDPFVQEVTRLLEDVEEAVVDANEVGEEVARRLRLERTTGALRRVDLGMGGNDPADRGVSPNYDPKIRMPDKRWYRDGVGLQEYPDKIPRRIGPFEETIMRLVTSLFKIFKTSEALKRELQARIDVIGE